MTASSDDKGLAGGTERASANDRPDSGAKCGPDDEQSGARALLRRWFKRYHPEKRYMRGRES